MSTQKTHIMATRSSDQTDSEYFENAERERANTAPKLPPKTSNANRSAAVELQNTSQTDTSSDQSNTLAEVVKQMQQSIAQLEHSLNKERETNTTNTQEMIRLQQKIETLTTENVSLKTKQQTSNNSPSLETASTLSTASLSTSANNTVEVNSPSSREPLNPPASSTTQNNAADQTHGVSQESQNTSSFQQHGGFQSSNQPTHSIPQSHNSHQQPSNYHLQSIQSQNAHLGLHNNPHSQVQSGQTSYSCDTYGPVLGQTSQHSTQAAFGPLSYHNSVPQEKIKTAEPIKFTGSYAENAEDWLDSLQFYNKCHHIFSDHSAALSFRARLDGYALSWFKSMPSEVQNSFLLVKEAFKAEFIDNVDPYDTVVDPRTCKVRTPQEFETFVQVHRMYCIKRKFSEESKLWSFFEFLPASLSHWVRSQSPKTLSQATNSARHIFTAQVIQNKGSLMVNAIEQPRYDEYHPNNQYAPHQNNSSHNAQENRRFNNRRYRGPPYTCRDCKSFDHHFTKCPRKNWNNNSPAESQQNDSSNQGPLNH